MSVLVLSGCGCRPPSEGALLVFAAASTAEAVTEAARRFEAEAGVSVQVHCAASSTLARQIEAGAGADLYLSANPQWMDYLVARGCMDLSSRRDLLANRLVLVRPRRSAEPPAEADVTVFLRQLEGRLALADPEHVPAGTYARQALQSLGLYTALQHRLLTGSSVRVTLAYVERGEVELGIVYATDAHISERVQVLGVFPDASHDPIRYHAAAAVEAADPARDFLAFLATPPAQRLFTRFGFLPVEESLL